MAEQASQPEQDQAESLNGGDGRPRSRSPNYPIIGLPEAIERAKQLHAETGRHAALRSAVVGAWGISPKSSAGSQTIGALRSFGLLETEGRGESAKHRLTRDALMIVHDPEASNRRKDAIQACALRPEAHQIIREQYGADLPADGVLRSFLIVDCNYTEQAAEALIAEYRDTMAFAGLDAGGDAANNSSKPVQVGDWVQWTSQGVAQFPEPREVQGLSEDGAYAFVAGSQAGIPMDQLTKESAPVVKPPSLRGTPPPNPFAAFAAPASLLPQGMAEETSKIGDAGLARIQWPEGMDQAGFDDFEYWLEGVLRKVARQAGVERKSRKSD
jgi:hypothetical protein